MENEPNLDPLDAALDGAAEATQVNVAIHWAVEHMREAEDAAIMFALGGSAALWLHGYDVEVPDVDFLVSEPPLWLPHANSSVSGPSDWSGVSTVFRGVKVEFVPAVGRESTETNREIRQQMLDRAYLIGQVPTLTVKDIILWKKMADRPKDVDFIQKFNSGKIRKR